MHSSELSKIRFATTRFREGYSMPAVDDFINEIFKSLQQWESGRPGQLTSEALISSRFASTKFAQGYDQDGVDNFLDEASATLAAFEAGKRP